MRKRTSVLVGLAICCIASAHAALVTYTFGTGTGTPGPSFTDPNVTASAFTTINVGETSFATGPAGGTDLAFTGNRGWHSPFADGNAGYFTFTVTANTGFQLDLTSLSIQIRSDVGPLNYEVRSSADNFASAVGSGTVGASWINPSVDLSGAAYQDLASITFRVYGLGDPNNGNGSLFSIDNVVVDGLAPVPEPATVALALFGMGSGGVAMARRLRRSRGQEPA